MKITIEVEPSDMVDKDVYRHTVGIGSIIASGDDGNAKMKLCIINLISDDNALQDNVDSYKWIIKSVRDKLTEMLRRKTFEKDLAGVSGTIDKAIAQVKADRDKSTIFN